MNRAEALKALVALPLAPKLMFGSDLIPGEKPAPAPVVPDLVEQMKEVTGISPYSASAFASSACTSAWSFKPGQKWELDEHLFYGPKLRKVGE